MAVLQTALLLNLKYEALLQTTVFFSNSQYIFCDIMVLNTLFAHKGIK